MLVLLQIIPINRINALLMRNNLDNRSGPVIPALVLVAVLVGCILLSMRSLTRTMISAFNSSNVVPLIIVGSV